VLLLALAACSKPRAPAVRRVILISCDTLRADRLGCYGYARPTSPHVDAFAKDAVLFEDAWSTAPLTNPAMSALLSGRIPDEIGMSRGNHVVMPPAVVTLPEILSEAGIETAAVVSIAVLQRPPARFGDAGTAQGFRTYDDDLREPETNRPYLQRGGEPTTDAAIRWLSADPERPAKPFFLWVHYQDPHGPYTPREPFASQFATPIAPDEPELPLGADESPKGQIPSIQIVGGERHASSYRDRYDAEIREFDEAFGRLLDWLREHGLYEDTLIVLTADHGESLGEHGIWFAHGENLHAEELHVPLVVRGPGLARGLRRREPASHLDVLPTVLEAFGLPARESRGVSLFSPSFPRDRLLPHSLGKIGERGRWTGVTGPRFRLLLESGGSPRLYDRSADPAELGDLAASEPDRVRDLAAACVPLFKSKSAAAPELVDPDAEKALRALGYTSGDQER
jgi:arylsulfatase